MDPGPPLECAALDDVRDEQGTRHRSDSTRVRAEPAGDLIDAVRDVTLEASLILSLLDLVGRLKLANKLIDGLRQLFAGCPKLRLDFCGAGGLCA